MFLGNPGIYVLILLEQLIDMLKHLHNAFQ
jgi:hypothetical protein